MQYLLVYVKHIEVIYLFTIKSFKEWYFSNFYTKSITTVWGNHWLPQLNNRIVLLSQMLKVTQVEHDNILFIEKYTSEHFNYLYTDNTDYIIPIPDLNKITISPLKKLIQDTLLQKALYLPDIFFKTILCLAYPDLSKNHAMLIFQDSTEILQKLIKMKNISTEQLYELVKYKTALEKAFIGYQSQKNLYTTEGANLDEIVRLIHTLTTFKDILDDKTLKCEEFPDPSKVPFIKLIQACPSSITFKSHRNNLTAANLSRS